MLELVAFLVRFEAKSRLRTICEESRRSRWEGRRLLRTTGTNDKSIVVEGVA